MRLTKAVLFVCSLSAIACPAWAQTFVISSGASTPNTVPKVTAVGPCSFKLHGTIPNCVQVSDSAIQDNNGNVAVAGNVNATGAISATGKVTGNAPNPGGLAVFGLAQPPGTSADTDGGLGVVGQTFFPHGGGVMGQSFPSSAQTPQHDDAHGVLGVASNQHGAGVFGWNNNPNGGGNGVFGINSGIGGVGVLAVTDNQDPNAYTFAIRAVNNTMSGTAIELAVKDVANTDLIRGVVGSNVVYRVNRAGTLTTGVGADVAEYIDGTERLEPGDVVEINPERTGSFRKVRSACSTLVAGIVSTLPGVALGSQKSGQDSRPMLAVVGRVPVNITAEGGPVRIGDLLTSSSSPGYAMRCAERVNCIGAVLGKALEPLPVGTGKILALVTLQ